SALSDDLPDLLEDDCLAKNISERVIMFDRFLEQELSAGRSALELKISENNTPPQFLVHGHCHQKTLDGGQWTHKLLQRIPGVVITDTEAGCCGMAGTFGYEKEHHELSKKIAQQRLLPKVNEASKQTLVISNGFSCRHQIKDLTTRKPIHVAEALRMFI
ncbi:MAG: FAD-binding oxidoreductase, partial [Candidatus Scalindua sp.]|nr:FAD-binding oxidoreductase [Candidatus Scalindua sp.]